MLYTIIDPEFVMRQQENQETPPKRKEVVLDGIRLEVFEKDDRNYIVNRIISTNPSDFLRPEIQPGRALTVDINPRQ